MTWIWLEFFLKTALVFLGLCVILAVLVTFLFQDDSVRKGGDFL